MSLPPAYNLSVDELGIALGYFDKDTVLAASATAAAVTKQQQSKQQQQSTSTTTTTSTLTTTMTSSNAGEPAAPPPVTICNLQVNDAASAKVVWASLAFDVSLQVDTAPPKKNDAALNQQQHPILTLNGTEQISGGGNAMALALSLKGSNKTISLTEQLMQDDWCEWERTVLRKAVGGNDDDKKKKWTAALDHLNASLTSSGVHVVGTSTTVADICLLSTLLHHTTAAAPLPKAVDRYVKAHAAQWTKVTDALQELVKQQQQQSSTGSTGAAATATLEDVTQQPSLLQMVDGVFRQALDQLFGSLLPPPPANTNNKKPIVTKCSDPKHGDYQCSAAMSTFAALKKSGTLPSQLTSALQVAEELVKTVGHDHALVTDLQVNGRGFVVCRIRATVLQQHVQAFLQSQTLPLPSGITPQTCVVDFSSPNIAKEMHVGHLRSTIIGESVCRILELVGHKVHRVNHVGDWGTQFGMLIQYLKEEYPGVSSGAELPNITDLTEFYKNAKKRFDEDADFKKSSQLNVVQLQSGDADCLRIWNLLCDISRKEFEKVYKRLDVSVEECGESFYNAKIPPVIDEFQKAGLLKEEEGGAKVVFTDAAKIPLMLQKSDGGYGYDSTDMAALKYRLQELKADRIIVITDFSQGDHFKMVYAAGRKIGWVDRGQRLDHIGFGTVQGEDGKRFKTRSGDTVRLVDLLDEAASRLEESLKQRIQEGAAHITLEEAHAVAEAIGYGSVKYFDLRRNPTSNYKFSYDMMLDTKGDTGVYLLYARVRLESILAKAQAEHGVDLTNLGTVQITHASERNLALALQQFPDVINTALDQLYPYYICTYVYELSIAASEFVTQCRVLGSPEMKSRLLLCQATAMAMKQAFDLLGIRHVKRI